VFIDDVADAFANVLHRTPTASIERFDVGSGSPSTVLELATEIANYYDAPSPHVTGAYREGDVRYAACELDAMTAQFDWSPQWDLSRGVQRLQQWIADSA
jgi:dTDP-L-rhamnose 4-epimerase